MGSEDIYSLELRSTLYSILSGLQKNGALDRPLQKPRDPNEQARYVNGYIAAALQRAGKTGTVTISIIDTADIWRDERSAVARSTDYVRPSTLAYGAVQKAAFSAKKRRQLYESKTRLGTIGRNAARLGDVALLGGAIAAGLMTGVIPGMHTGTADRPTATQPTHPAGTQTPGSTSQTPKPPTTVETPPPPPKQTTTYTAKAHDFNGKPSTVTGISQETLRKQAAGLPAAVITAMVHDQGNIDQLNNAFMHDKADPDNVRVLHDSRHWLFEGTRYSIRDVNKLASQMAGDQARKLGITLPSAQAPIVIQKKAPSTSNTSTATAAPQTKQTSEARAQATTARGSKLSKPLAAIASIIVGGGGIGVIKGAVNLYGKQRSRRKAPAAARRNVATAR
jgi:hypothetical protein